MPDISTITIKEVSYVDPGKRMSPEVVQIIEDEFYCQLKKASNFIGKPLFSRCVTILLGDRCLFNSTEGRLIVEEYCIDQNNKPTWNLQEALSHEVVHVIVGNAPGQPYRAPAFVMEEGLAYHNSMRLLSFVNYEGHSNILNAVACIEEALRAVPNLLTKWRNQNGEARAVQTLTDDDLKRWGLGDDLRRKLLSDFV